MSLEQFNTSNGRDVQPPPPTNYLQQMRELSTYPQRTYPDWTDASSAQSQQQPVPGEQVNGSSNSAQSQKEVDPSKSGQSQKEGDNSSKPDQQNKDGNSSSKKSKTYKVVKSSSKTEHTHHDAQHSSHTGHTHHDAQHSSHTGHTHHDAQHSSHTGHTHHDAHHSSQTGHTHHDANHSSHNGHTHEGHHSHQHETRHESAHESSKHAHSQQHSHSHLSKAHKPKTSDKHLPSLSVKDASQSSGCPVDPASSEHNVNDMVDSLWHNKISGQNPFGVDQSGDPSQAAPSWGYIHEKGPFGPGAPPKSQWRPGDPTAEPDRPTRVSSPSLRRQLPVAQLQPPPRLTPEPEPAEAPLVPPPPRSGVSPPAFDAGTETPEDTPALLANLQPPAATDRSSLPPFVNGNDPRPSNGNGDSPDPTATYGNGPLPNNGDGTAPVPANGDVTASLNPSPRHSDAPPPAPTLNNTGQFNVSLINDNELIPMTGALPNDPQNKIFAGKNETQSVQVAIQAPAQGLTNVDVSSSSLRSADGSTIDSSNIKLYREHYTQVTRSSNSAQKANPANPAGAPGMYADGLIPFIDPATGQPGKSPQPDLVGNNFKVQGGQNQPVWADVQIPKDAKPGTYSGVFTVKSDQGQVQVPYQVHVWNFENPTKPYLNTAFGAIGNNDNAVQQVLLDNKISPVAPDPAHMKQDLAEGLTGSTVGFFSGASYDHPSASGAPSVAAIQARKDAIQQAAGPGNNLQIYDYAFDEIRPGAMDAQVQQWGNNLHAAGVANLATMAPGPGLMGPDGKPSVDIFSMLPVVYDRTAPGVMQQFRDKGAQMWSYNTLVQDDYSPKWELDYSPAQERVQAGFISQSLNLTGLLDWSVSNWSGDPWHNPYKTFVEPGEGVLVLPGQAAGLQGDAPTIRLKALRDGVGDYNYAQMLKNLGNSALADQVSKSVGANFSHWSNDPAALERAHEELGNALEQLAEQKQGG